MNGSKKRILVICPNPENVAPGQRLKYEQYFEYLRSHGYDITVSPFMTRALWDIVYKPGNIDRKVFWTLVGYARRVVDLARTPFYDGVYVFLNVTPFGTSLFERALRLVARKLVYDIDDLVFLGKTAATNRMLAPLKGRGKYIYLMKCADHVVTCTPYLDEFVRQYNSRTTDISSTIRTDRYVPKGMADYASGRRLVLGWSGSHSTSPYLKLLTNVLKDVAARHAFTLRVIGDPAFVMPGVDVEAMPWSEPTEVEDLRPIDIGLYPLPDEQWVYGKSGLKALQYMALGIPTVATAIGANFRVIEDEVSGFLVKDDAEWTARLEQLIADPGLRRRIGQRASERVERMFSVRANEPVYRRVFDEAYGAASVNPVRVAGA